MADVYKRIYQGQPSASAATLYTATGVTAIIKHLRIVNTDVTTRWVKLWQGGTADSNLILPQIDVPAGGLIVEEAVIIVGVSDTLAGQAEVASKLTITAYGIESS